MTTVEERALSAYHEAGHALGYVRQHRAELRLVSIDGGGGGLTHGRACGFDMPTITALGPIAEAMHSLTTYDPDEGIEFHDCLSAAVWTGACAEDYALARDLLKHAGTVGFFREVLAEHWDGMDRLAHALIARGTVSGTEAAELLGAAELVL